VLAWGFAEESTQIFLIEGESVPAEKGKINKGEEVKVMPLRFLIAARAGSQEVDTGKILTSI
jgi:hypothetical protein